MAKTERKFETDSVIYMEGTPASSVYEVTEGSVELTRSGEQGPVTLAFLQSGETFGHEDVGDDGAYSSTATAVGSITVQVIPRQEYLATNPDTSTANLPPMVMPPPMGAQPDAPGESSSNPIANAVRWFFRPFKAGAQNKSSDTSDIGRSVGFGGIMKSFRPPLPGERLQVIIGPIAGEDSTAQTRALTSLISRRAGLSVRAAGSGLKMIPEAEGVDLASLDQNPELVDAIGDFARKWLFANGGDLLIWGGSLHPGSSLQLRFVNVAPDDDERAGLFGLSTSFTLPAGFAAEWGPPLHAACLAAGVPADRKRAIRLARHLPNVVTAATAFAASLPPGLDGEEEATVYTSTANALAYYGVLARDTALLQQAGGLYQTGLDAMPAEPTTPGRGRINRNLGVAMQWVAELSDDPDNEALCLAVDSYRDALKGLNKDLHPELWAATQNRFGMALYRLDLKTGDTEMTRFALDAFQLALQVFNRQNTPLQWAEVMNNFSLAAQLLGDQLRNPDVLQKAVDACHSALEIRRREKLPMLWASTQNNLGSALFLLGRLKKSRAALEEAREAFSQAHDFYQSYGAHNMAAIADKNLSRVDRILAKAPKALGNKGTEPKGLPPIPETDSDSEPEVKPEPTAEATPETKKPAKKKPAPEPGG